jgi:hypothetical protein
MLQRCCGSPGWKETLEFIDLKAVSCVLLRSLNGSAVQCCCLLTFLLYFSSQTLLLFASLHGYLRAMNIRFKRRLGAALGNPQRSVSARSTNGI